MTSIESLQKCLSLLKEEKEEDLQQYKQKILRTSLQERKKTGLSWYPVILIKTVYGTGERVIVVLERTSEFNRPHIFQSGKLVNIFLLSSGRQDIEEQVSGVVNFVKGNAMTVTLNLGDGDRDLPDWFGNGKLGIDLLFDEASYKEMEFAISQMINAKGRALELREIIIGSVKPKFKTLKNNIADEELNHSQNEALQHILSAEDVSLVHGPPGTGKTTTLVQSIIHVLKAESQVLVCAPSNAAVDLLVEKLSLKGINVVRLGHPARVTEDALEKTVDALMTKHPVYADLKRIRQKKEEFRKLAYKYKRNFGHAERSQRKMLLQEASSLRAEAEALEYYILEDIMGKAQVIACTLVGASANHLQKRRFSTLFIDEAAQALEPACWIPILRSDRVVFAGDHCQLPPTIKSIKAAKDGLAETLFEKVITQKEIGSLLKLQYRMNQMIMGFSNAQFYGNALKAHEIVAQHILIPGEAPFEFVDTAGCSYTEQINSESLSRYNIQEADFLLYHLESLMQRVSALFEKSDAVEAFSIGIISPYKSQINLLSEALTKFPTLEVFKECITIDTIDAFQGRERDIIYISLVRSNEEGEIGFLKELRRINVAMTRARKKLVVIGDSATLGQNKFYSDLIDYSVANNAYKSVFEFSEYL